MEHFLIHLPVQQTEYKSQIETLKAKKTLSFKNIDAKALSDTTPNPAA